MPTRQIQRCAIRACLPADPHSGKAHDARTPSAPYSSQQRRVLTPGGIRKQSTLSLRFTALVLLSPFITPLPFPFPSGAGQVHQSETDAFPLAESQAKNDRGHPLLVSCHSDMLQLRPATLELERPRFWFPVKHFSHKAGGYLQTMGGFSDALSGKLGITDQHSPNIPPPTTTTTTTKSITGVEVFL
ncbi:hypothetical protein JZ751_020477 [Albula glossodonta]|uniref:Uncharacterized protein n=1 Tax=Albula glossodonta TaxID=121402 RepID=A0A8T2PHW1_9TELE|nr:hypothetical protein JZ751_020477 [Albula glossodonta]